LSTLKRELSTNLAVSTCFLWINVFFLPVLQRQHLKIRVNLTLTPLKKLKDGTLFSPKTGEIVQDIARFVEVGQNYLDNYDELHNSEKKLAQKFNRDIFGGCIAGFMHGSCSSNHNFAKVIVCGKEYCSECGQEDSIIHKRRIANWWDKMHSLDSIGYLVFTLPMEVREDFLGNQKLLSSYRLYIKRKLQRMGYDKGLMRWHWAGDCPSCKHLEEKGCEHCDYTGASRIWHPHLNILIEEGYMSPGRLAELKRGCTKWLQRELHIDLQYNTVVNYQYTHEPDKKTHLLKYITRATWRFKKNLKVVQTIYKYRTSQSWGKFEPKGESKSDLVLLQKGRCPCCYKEKRESAIKWHGFLGTKEAKEFILKGSQLIEGGYFLLQDSPPEEIIKPPPKYGLIPVQNPS